ncbi:MIOREX complex component 2 [[Candida] anglica]|uniref:MIOREX complex component 2 n=1 Tax=[Candida] anglica TaxID=148631 RepID=A0ABP0EK48_9ASCO
MVGITKSIAVFGGNGFLGKRICEQGIRSGYNVISLTRSGIAPKIESHHDAHWISKVQWKKADLLDPKTYKEALGEVDTVVHSVGMLFEDQQYKKVMNSNPSIPDLLKLIKGGNPMAKDSKTTYESIQRDSAVIIADAFLKENSKKKNKSLSYVYISADKLPPFIPAGYINTKREAEVALSSKPGLRTILMRPGIMSDETESLTSHRNKITSLLSYVYGAKESIFGKNVPFLNANIRPSVSTQQVSRKIFEKLEDSNFSGVVLLEDIATK